MSSTLRHWTEVYANPDHQGSWHRPTLNESITAIRRVAPRLPCDFLDIGAGRQRLGLSDVFDEPGTATAYAVDLTLQILGEPRPDVSYIAGDVLKLELPKVDVWHDRAVLHFFTDVGERATYRDQVARTVRPGGGVVIACFDISGPEQCSGLPVVRRRPEDLAEEFQELCEVVELNRSVHVTPAGVEQQFSWFLGRKI
ncbi:MAG: SAM-dependent methyltransferase [Acidobacteria bacterium]|nr:SAM-dependent methyltransferase [Acidobacteriota bacterium]